MPVKLRPSGICVCHLNRCKYTYQADVSLYARERLHLATFARLTSSNEQTRYRFTFELVAELVEDVAESNTRSI